MTVTKHNSTPNINFSMMQTDEMEKFERSIAYFFGANNIGPIADAYIGALQILEELGTGASQQERTEKMLPFLEKAYREIKTQTALEFDSRQAAIFELELILAQSENSGFERITQIMVDLYELIFKSKSFDIHKAAMLRTFLYQYKVRVIKSENRVSESDKMVMLTLAKASEELLNGLQ